MLSEPKPRLVRMSGILPDFEESFKQRISFNFSHNLVSLEGPMNLLIEIRTSDPSDSTTLKSTGWTIMPLFNPANEPNFGRWRLPFYRTPTNLSVDIRQVPTMT